MQVEISPRAQARIDELLSHGGFQDAAEVIEAAVEGLAARDRAYWDSVGARVEEGARDIREGRYTVLTPETAPAVTAEIIATARQRRFGPGSE